MNLVEFMFAFVAVFGSTAVFTLWQYLMYKLDQSSEQEKEKSQAAK
jgi:hypothetical protein